MVNGSCLCGQVTFALGEPLSNMNHCHCSMCRKAHGSLFATYAQGTELNYTSGQDQIRTYLSSEGLTRAFCNTCGSVLPEEAQQEGACYVPAGLLDDDPKVRPEAHIFVESKSEYYQIHDDLPQHTHYGDGDLSRVVNTPEVAATPGKITGGCLCGDVEFSYTGTPKFVMNCHCSRCRKVKSAAHATNAFVPADDFIWEKGEDQVLRYDLPEADSFGHCFCGRCGSSLPRKSATNGMMNIPVGSLDSAPGADARGHIFTSYKAPWFEISDELPQWDEMPG